jgi:hypothetical protein
LAAGGAPESAGAGATAAFPSCSGARPGGDPASGAGTEPGFVEGDAASASQPRSHHADPDASAIRSSAQVTARQRATVTSAPHAAQARAPSGSADQQLGQRRVEVIGRNLPQSTTANFHGDRT